MTALYMYKKQSMQNMVRVGIIGTNWGGKVQTPIFRAAGLEVVAIYSRNISKAQKLCESMKVKYAFDSVEELCSCPEVDVVSITSPTHLHAQHALIALRAGKHVLSDKPGGSTVLEVEEMLEEAAKRTNQFAIIDHEMRFTPAVQAARKAIFLDKLIGDIRHFDSHQMMNFNSFGRNHVWWNEREKGGGILGAAGVHYIDQLHYIMGQKITHVNALTETFVKEKRMHPKQWKTKEDETKMLPCTAEEYVAAQFRCNGGALGTLSITGVMIGQSGGTTYFNGTKGSAKLTGRSLIVYDSKGDIITQTDDDKIPEDLRRVAGDHAGAPALGTFNIAVAIRDFLDGNDQALNDACSFADALYNQKVMEAIHLSNESMSLSRL